VPERRLIARFTCSSRSRHGGWAGEHAYEALNGSLPSTRPRTLDLTTPLCCGPCARAQTAKPRKPVFYLGTVPEGRCDTTIWLIVPTASPMVSRGRDHIITEDYWEAVSCCGRAEASYMKHRTESHTETTIFRGPHAHWSGTGGLRLARLEVHGGRALGQGRWPIPCRRS
jgi:hypothetical protein